MKMIICLIQTRMKSTRLPGKCMMKMNDIPMTSYTIAAAKQSKLIDVDGIIYPIDDEKVFRKKYGYDCFCYGGSENDVLDRYYKAMLYIENIENKKCSHIIRLTSDCPLLAYNSFLIDSLISQHLKDDNDLTHNRGENNYPSGLDIEIMPRNILVYANEYATGEEREHVTLYIKDNADKFKIGGFKKHLILSNYKWSVDTIEDFKRVEDIIKIYSLSSNIMDDWR